MTHLPLAALIALIVLSVALIVIIAGVGIGIATHHVTLHFAHDDDEDTDDLPDDTAALLSMMPGTSIVVDDNDGVVRCSPAAYHLGVVEEDAIIDATVLDAVHEARKSGGKRQFDLTTSTPERYAAEHGGNEHVTAQSVTRPNWLKVTVARISDKFVIILIADVSEIVRFGQVRDSFITNVSEQLLKPTQALSQLADSLEHGDLNRERITDDARQVRSSCTKLNHMVSDLLLLIRAQEPITPSSANRLNVMDQLRATIDRLQPEAQQAGVELRLKGDDALVINGLADQIDSAVTKLVENAIGYSKDNGVVSVSASLSKDGDRALIRVIDQGAGIAKQDQDRIFERFYRGASQTARTADGVGLGLAIVKHVALTHHGDVSVWSAAGQGSTFTLSLPLAQ
ncbi:ATPase [Bifidobacterium sp. LC6]|uniref:Sensor-like histidine kinase SenX3 n=1 Tax=Bifidobacterium colobi TaxID=2809026 RepID=A0ABS5UWX0_9BIFI|nr:ATP-binding protein [Bifidobacterium colobi]MBT1175626.1 ATPase [Bifidobacterium colobi]